VVNISSKAAISLLISILLFAGFAVLAYTDLFDLVETRFYNPSVARSSSGRIGEDAKAIGNFLSEIQAHFAASLAEDAVRGSFTLNQRTEDIFERSRIYGTMLESQGGLQAVRFVDSGGSRIHYSTSPEDVLRQDQGSIAYRAYNGEGGELPFEKLEVPSQGRGKIVFDEANERLVFSFPFYDSLDVYRGSALFYLSARAVSHRLIREGLIKIGNEVSVTANPGGFVLGLPPGEKQALLPLIASAWNEGILSPVRLASEETQVSLVLVSAKTGDIFAGLLLEESLFAISPAMKIILLASFFFTVYLIVFLFFNFRQDPVTVVENRLKRLRIALLEQYYDTPEETDREHWGQELERRREEIRLELKRGLKTKGKDLDALIDGSWDDLLSIIGVRRNGLGIGEKKLEEILNRILRKLPAPDSISPLAGSGTVPIPSPGEPVPPSAGTGNSGEPEGPEELEELEELEEPGEADGLEDPAGSGAAPPAETGAAEKPEELEEMEELEELEEPEELEEVDEPEELGENAGAAGSAPPLSGRMTAAAGFGDSALTRDAPAGKEPEEPEDIDEEPGELEELEEDVPEGPVAHPMTGTRIDEIASEIEFAESPPEDDSGEDVTMKLDIASPFDLMVFEPGEEDGGELPAGPEQEEPGPDGDTSSSVNTEGEKKNFNQPPPDEEELEELAVVNETGLEEIGEGSGLSYIYRPFSLAGFRNLTPLKALPDDSSPTAVPSGKDAATGERFIEEREGLHYISDHAFKADGKTGQALNPKFKDLVDSVLGETKGTGVRPKPL
jgi:hypothetical protein